MISNEIIYDIIALIFEDFTESNIELLFKVMKTSGFKLRSENPIALRDIINKMNEKTNGKESKRIKVFLDLINDLKNNKLKNDDTEKYREQNKFLKEISDKFNKPNKNPMKISYQDLIEAKEKGRWWLVGSAWQGRKTETSQRNENNPLVNFKDAESQSKLEKLAKKQRITTDLKKSIFFILLSSEDYLDAFSKLARLDLIKNDKEIVTLILHCCCQEKVFNPYYLFLSEKICTVDKQIPRTFQYCFYDFLKKFETFKVQNVINLSFLMSNLVLKNILSLAILKTIQFESLQKNEILFFRIFFMELFLNEESSKCFVRISKLNHVDDLKDDLKLFLYQFMDSDSRRNFIFDVLPIKNSDETWMKEQDKIIKKRAKLAYKILSF
jgi:nucleolar MIF4G domain-containing protein 1